MGLAVLIDHENCLNFLGLRCDVCYRVCPVIDKAITLEKVSNPRSDRHAMLLPTVHADACTGCGKCEKSCVLEQAAIKVLPRELAQGELGHHYRKGWEAPQREAQPQFDQPTCRTSAPGQRFDGDLVRLRGGQAGLPAMPRTVRRHLPPTAGAPRRAQPPRPLPWRRPCPPSGCCPTRVSGWSRAAPSSRCLRSSCWGRWAGVWMVKGNLSSSLTLGVLPLTDPVRARAVRGQRHWPERAALIGVGIVLFAYGLWGGPLRLGLPGQRGYRMPPGCAAGKHQWWAHSAAQSALLAARCRASASARTGQMVWEAVNPSRSRSAPIFGGGLAWAALGGRVPVRSLRRAARLVRPRLPHGRGLPMRSSAARRCCA